MARVTWSRRGIERERSLAKKLREEGWIVIRSAGSLGKIDLCAINPESKQIEFLQLKGESMPDSKKRELEKELEVLNDSFSCKFRVVEYWEYLNEKRNA